MCRAAAAARASRRGRGTPSARRPARRPAHELLLGAIDLPLRRQVAAVLAGVGVPDHHLERRPRAAVEQLLDELWRAGAGRRSSRAAARPATSAPASQASASASSTSPATLRHRDDHTVERTRPVPLPAPARQLRACAGAAHPEREPRTRGRAGRASPDEGRTPGRERRSVRERAVGDRGRRDGHAGSRRGRRDPRAARHRRVSVVGEPAPRSPRVARGTARPRRSELRDSSPTDTVVDIPHARAERANLVAVAARARAGGRARARLDRLRAGVRVSVEIAADPACRSAAAARARARARAVARASRAAASHRLCSTNHRPFRISSTTAAGATAPRLSARGS